MQKAKHGRIVNISSTAGVRGFQYVSAYCAAKHGVVGFTKALAIELNNSGITVNAVCPGFTNTDLFQKSVDEVVKKTARPREEIVREFLKDAPGGNLIEPQVVADKVVWFCEKEQRSVTGEALVIEGK
jgi:NAD(P)-dependent dehydrogenase (short-subunit alcohol dehydrogenase family)